MASPLFPNHQRATAKQIKQPLARDLPDLIRILRELPKDKRLAAAQQHVFPTMNKRTSDVLHGKPTTIVGKQVQGLFKLFRKTFLNDTVLNIFQKVFGPGGERVRDNRRDTTRVPDRTAAPPESVPSLTKTSGKPKKKVDIPRGGTGTGTSNMRVAANDPIITGEMVLVSSSNVHSIGYDIDHSWLYVRFLQHEKPGSLYRYAHVSPDEFQTLRRASSKGGYVWDHLRVRGTVSGHKKPYVLAGTMRKYVPRQAMQIGDTEYFVRRTVTTVSRSGRTAQLKSSLPTVAVRRVQGPSRPSSR